MQRASCEQLRWFTASAVRKPRSSSARPQSGVTVYRAAPCDDRTVQIIDSRPETIYTQYLHTDSKPLNTSLGGLLTNGGSVRGAELSVHAEQSSDTRVGIDTNPSESYTTKETLTHRESQLEVNEPTSPCCENQMRNGIQFCNCSSLIQEASQPFVNSAQSLRA